jgi:hypothetical protein
MIHLLAQVHRYPLFCFKYMLKKSQEDSESLKPPWWLVVVDDFYHVDSMDVMVAGTYVQKLSSIFM